ncbi:hypothetical protein CDD81_8099 [Ophiocordyceps australis]|uniref:Uncharacterized protein n=1 Tax=Ophiocordyceps australis TaxID=1399860 RepID=A0A2C5XWJ6_9HYPO|nr:hypothetical protein CDD81_8099 [Ophiocordyceps australis]
MATAIGKRQQFCRFQGAIVAQGNVPSQQHGPIGDGRVFDELQVAQDPWEQSPRSEGVEMKKKERQRQRHGWANKKRGFWRQAAGSQMKQWTPVWFGGCGEAKADAMEEWRRVWPQCLSAWALGSRGDIEWLSLARWSHVPLLMTRVLAGDSYYM